MKVFRLTIFLLFSQISFSQNLNTYQLSSYAGVYGLGFNPASIADTRYSYHLNLGAVAGSFGQNVLHNSYLPLSQKTFSFSKQDFKTERIDILGPSLMVQLPKGNSFAISTKYRAGQNTRSNNISNLFENSNQFFNNSIDDYKSVALREYALSYAHPLAFEKHFIKIGASYKMQSIANYTKVVLGQGNFNQTASSSNPTKEFSGNVIVNSTNIENELNVSNLFKNKIHGAGIDFGFIYEFRPKHEEYAYQMDGKKEYDQLKTKYLLKLAFSIMDVGIIARDKINSLGYSTSLVNYKIDDSSVGGTILKDLTNMKLGTNSSIFQQEEIKLPQRINIFIDAKLGNKGWFLGAFMNTQVQSDAIINNFVPRNTLAPQSIFALVPRYEKDGFDFSMPIIYQKETKKYGLGLQLNLGSLFIGTESVNGFFQKNGPNPTVYAGFSISKLAKKIKDSDGDGVSDKQDICPEIKGLWLFKGCPDTDGDGIKDSEDDCPEHAGPKETKGCPDTDKDGIFDKNDACPTAAGPIKFNGCPDTDGDGLPDSEDECPTKPGSKEFGGCPDTDKDGLMDNEDECPELPGIKLLKGCPDTDGDGIADKYDTCPNAKGSLANKGCPDTDNDGIIDKEDACPTEAGTKPNNGCPDTDNDGVIDKNDPCPKEKGEVEFDGCPIQNLTKNNEDLAIEQNKILTNLTNEIIAKSVSLNTLDQIAKSVTSVTNSKLEIMVKGAKSGILMRQLSIFLKEIFTNIPFELIEENQPNQKTSLEIIYKE